MHRTTPARRFLPHAVLTAAGFGLVAATPLIAAADSNVDFPRFPAVSPDGDEVVFSWRGDLWKVETGGGTAMRLTSHPSDDLRSVWSPDGDRIAFNSTRDGYNNIWTMNADGTDVTRVTNTDRGSSISDWAEINGKDQLLFSGVHDLDVYRDARPYFTSIDGGPIQRLHDAFGVDPVLSPDGRHILFARGGYYDGWERRHYRGAENQDVWLLDRSDNSFTQLTEWNGNDGKAKWMDDDTILYLSDREDDSVDLYRRDLDDDEGDAQRIATTKRDIHDWSVSRDGTTAVLMSWDTLYSVDLTKRNSKPKAIEINAPNDAGDDFTYITIRNNVTEAELSPDGKTMAMVAYGEVYVRNIKDDSPTRRVTENHARERGIAWSPDGLKLYFSSDIDGTDSIYAATVTRTRDEIREEFDKAMNPEKEEPEDEENDETDEEDPGDTESDDVDEDAGGDDAAANLDPISGTWTGSLEIPGQGSMSFSMELELGEDGIVEGTISTDLGSASGTGAWDPGSKTLTMSLVSDEVGVLELKATVSGGSLDGLITGGAGEIPITADRMGADAADNAGDEPDASDDDDADDDTEEADEEDDVEDDPMLDPKRWHTAISFAIEPVLVTDDNHRDPTPSPDGKSMIVRGTRGNLHNLDLASGEMRTVIETWDFGIDWLWSPDSSMISYSVSDLDFNSDIWIVPADGSSDAVNITRHPDNDGSMSWSADGRLMSFVSERLNEEYDVWFVALDESFESLGQPEREEYFEDAKKAVKARKPIPVAGTKAARKAEEKAAKEAEKKAESGDGEDEETLFESLDLDDAYLRVRRVTRLEGNEGQSHITPDGEHIIFSASGDISGLFSVKWNGRERKSMGGGARVAGMSLGGDKVVLVAGGQAATTKVGSSSRETIAISDRIRIDLEAQSSQKFLEAARTLGENYYHPTMNGVNWKKETKAYHDLARRAHTSSEFNWIANRFLGELNGSHMGIRTPGDNDATTISHGRLGVTTRRVDDGLEVTSIVPDSPADDGPMPIMIGDVITAIEFEPLDDNDTLVERLEGQTGKETVIRVMRSIEDADSGEAVMTELDLLVTPISWGGLRQLGYRAWTKENADQVHAMSDGRLGYIHIQSMGQPSLDDFERDLFAAAEGRDGLVLDVRNNGGGWTTDRILSSIMVQPHAYTVPRGADGKKRTHYPQDRLFIQRYMMPMNLLCNEKSYSNAEIISHAFKTLGRGTLVGQQTHGSVISTGGFGLIDGTSVRMPFRGWFVVKGDRPGMDMELNGAIPDLIVTQTPEAEVAGNDEQLRAAVTDLLERLDD